MSDAVDSSPSEPELTKRRRTAADVRRALGARAGAAFAWVRAAAPGREAWRGAAWGLTVLAAVAWLSFAVPMLFAHSLRLASVLLFLLCVAAAVLAGAVLVLVRAALHALPWRFAWALGSALAALVFVLAVLSVLGMALIVPSLALIAALAGAGVHRLVHRADATARQRHAASALVGLGALAAIAVVTWLLHDGRASPAPPNARAAGPAPPLLDVADPGLPGTLRVETLTYGSGVDRHRPEFGGKARLKTSAVDGSKLVSNWEGPGGWARTRYWGFDVKALPLQGRVWHPVGSGPFPLVLLVVHGNHDMQDFSDPGYGYLGELLASRGFIVVSVDENFLNGDPASLLGGPDGDLDEENDARGWLLLEHLKVWRGWNATPGHTFEGKVDLDRVALVGHSRGGEAVAVAAAFNRLPCDPDDARVAFDYGFGIRAIVAIAPVDGQYKPARKATPLSDVSYLTLHGSLDADMQSFHGSRVWERVKLTAGSDRFKATVYVHGANHGQFNTSWGRSDAGDNLWARFLNLRQIMPPEDQRRVARVFISAFLEASLHDERRLRPLFRDYRRGRPWLPEAVYLQHYQDATEQRVATHEEDLDVTTTTLPGGRALGQNLSDWKEKLVAIKWGEMDTQAVYLGWRTKEAPGVPSYAITLPETGLDLGAASLLVFSLADGKDEPSEYDDDDADDKDEAEDDEDGGDDDDDEARAPIDLSVELTDAAGASARLPLSRVAALQPQIEVEVLKADLLNDEPASEPVFQSFELPLAAFKEANDAFDPARLRTVRFVFDRSPEGLVVLDDVGFRTDPPPAAR
jgi:dienelactone hydrolase